MKTITYDALEKQPIALPPALALRRRPLKLAGHYKIGWAIDVEQRLKAVQTGCAGELSVYGVLPSAEPRALEQAAHKRFAKYRLRGEWFNDRGTSEIADFCDRYCYELGGVHRIWSEMHDGPLPRLPPYMRF